MEGGKRVKQRTLAIGLGVLLLGLALGLGGSMLLDGDATDAQNAELEVGDEAPEFELYDHTGAQVWLSDFRGKKKVVLAFYPAAWTPV
jgi:cytochrome oxidase Cu insertion factor (SCO1/SenC/PrrC family)